MKKLLIVLSIIGFMFAEGKISGVTYFDFSATDTKSAFNFQRQYFGYGGEVSDQVSYKILFDVGRTNVGAFEIEKDTSYKSEDTRLVVFLKKAQINYKSSFGSTYEYDLSNPSDRVRYRADPKAKLRDRLDVNPQRRIERNIGQHGGGVLNKNKGAQWQSVPFD